MTCEHDKEKVWEKVAYKGKILYYDKSEYEDCPFCLVSTPDQVNKALIPDDATGKVKGCGMSGHRNRDCHKPEQSVQEQWNGKQELGPISWNQTGKPPKAEQSGGSECEVCLGNRLIEGVDEEGNLDYYDCVCVKPSASGSKPASKLICDIEELLVVHGFACDTEVWDGKARDFALAVIEKLKGKL